MNPDPEIAAYKIILTVAESHVLVSGAWNPLPEIVSLGGWKCFDAAEYCENLSNPNPCYLGGDAVLACAGIVGSLASKIMKLRCSLLNS